MLHLNTHCVKIKKRRKKKRKMENVGACDDDNFAGGERCCSELSGVSGEGSCSGADSPTDKVSALASDDSHNIPSVQRLLESIRMETQSHAQTVERLAHLASREAVGNVCPGRVVHVDHT